MIGQLLQERFRLDARMGRWCGSEVYRAMDLERRQPVLVRILPQALASNENLWAQLVSRGQQVAAIDHPGVLPLLSLGRDADVAYLVQRYVQAKPLSEMWQTTGEPLAREQALAFVQQTGAALDAAHAVGVVHGALSLLDGFLPAGAISGDTATLDQAAAYAAPEQVGPGAGAPAADHYALAAMAFEWLTGQNPFASPGDTAAMMHERHVNMPMPLATSYDPTLPRAVDAAFRELLSKDPRKRPTSGAVLAERLALALQGKGSGTVKATPTWVWSLLGAATALLLVVGIAWAVLRSGGLDVAIGRLFGSGAVETPLAIPLPTTAATPSSAATLGVMVTLTPVPPTDTPVPLTATPDASPTVQGTNTPGPTATATLSPTATETATATLTASVTPTPTSTLPPPVCVVEPSGPLAGLWQAHKSELGCPLDINPIAGFWAEQPFQNGHMYWSEDGDLFLATIGGDSGAWASVPDDDSTWKEGMPDETCDPGTPDGLVLPIRGFGGLWCNYAALRSGLGWATANEQGFESGVVLLHRFSGGYLLRDSDGSSTGRAYVLRGSDNSFVRVPY
jgi:hypothetical protein